MEVWSNVFTLALFTATIRSATPILFPALAGIFSERSGVLNIALEGIMLISAFVYRFCRGGHSFGNHIFISHHLAHYE